MIPVVHIMKKTGDGGIQSTVLRLKCDDIRGVISEYDESELRKAETAQVHTNVEKPAEVIDVPADEPGSVTRSLKFLTSTDTEIEIDINENDSYQFEIYSEQFKDREGSGPNLRTRYLPVFVGALIGVLTKG
jgi:hypothetical protein